MKMLVFFLAKCVHRKNHGCEQKNQKALALLYLASKPLRKAANSSRVLTEFEQNWWGKFDLELFTFHQKDNWVFFWTRCNLGQNSWDRSAHFPIATPSLDTARPVQIAPLPTPVQCCFGHDACPYKSCGLQTNIERGEGGGQILCSSVRGLIKNNRKIRVCFQFVSTSFVRGCL